MNNINNKKITVLMLVALAMCGSWKIAEMLIGEAVPIVAMPIRAVIGVCLYRTVIKGLFDKEDNDE